MKHVPIQRVDLSHPARTDDNGITWYRPADGFGWTSDPAQAHLSYTNPHALVLQIASPSTEKGKNR